MYDGIFNHLRSMLAEPSETRAGDAFGHVHRAAVGLASSGAYHRRPVEALHDVTVTRHEDAPMPEFYVQVAPSKQVINPLVNATPQEAPAGHYQNIDVGTQEVRLVPVRSGGAG
jgi:hypothetical protein